MKLRLLNLTIKAALLCVGMLMWNNAFCRDDSTHTRVRTIGLVIGGTTIYGIGVNYEQSFSQHIQGETPKRYMYWHGCVGYAGSIVTTIGAGLHQSTSRSRKFFVNAGVNAGLWISLDPTPKEQRDYWDSIEFYGGNYVNPMEVILIPEVGGSYLGTHWFLRLQYTPLWITNRIGEMTIRFVHSGGLVTGYRF